MALGVLDFTYCCVDYLTSSLDGPRYLEVVFVQCNKPGGMQLRLLPFAIGSFMAYTVGFPLILALVLIKYRKRIYEDQVRVSFVVLVFSFLETCIPIHKSRKGRLSGVAYGVCDQTGGR